MNIIIKSSSIQFKITNRTTYKLQNITTVEGYSYVSGKKECLDSRKRNAIHCDEDEMIQLIEKIEEENQEE